MSANGLQISPISSAFNAFSPSRTGDLPLNAFERFARPASNVYNCSLMPENGERTSMWLSCNSSPAAKAGNVDDSRVQTAGQTSIRSSPTTAYEALSPQNVAEYVTVVDEEQSNFQNNAAYLGNGQYSALDVTWQDVQRGADYAFQMQPPNMTFMSHQSSPSSEQAVRRQIYYHQRHHPQMSTSVSNYGYVTDQLKNKNRFSATGSCGASAVVRDTKMSLSSSPPSPSAGAVGGSLGSTFAHHGFNSLPNRYPAVPFSTSQGGFCGSTGMRALSKKQSDMSVSSTLSSYSASSLSSTPSLTGISPRKRQVAGEDSLHSCASVNGWMAQNTSCHSSSGDVVAGVNSVRICDRSSSGSPIEYMAHRAEWPFKEQHHKRSRNDSEDDDVIFVSAIPGPGKPKQKLRDMAGPESGPVSSSSDPSSTADMPSKRARKCKKRCPKKGGRSNVMEESTSGGFAIPAASTFTTVSCQTQPTEQQLFVPASTVCNDPSTVSSKGYFLRSSVNGRPAKRRGIDQINNNVAEPVVASFLPTSATRYQTRRQQRKKQNPAQEELKTLQQQQLNAENSLKATAVADRQPQQPASVQHEGSCRTRLVPNASSSRPTSVIRSAPPSLESPQRRTSSHFKKLYEIQGMIGVGGGGSVFAATRKADGAQVAVKQVPRAKVRRWGELNGRTVPIEFELLHRATSSGNKGVIGMLDWYERRSCYLLVMERPQPVIDLFDYLNQHGALPENVARTIFRQLVEAVIHCHARGVVHRDIKDENVLLNLHTSEAKLIDFGCGTLLKDESYTEFAGTPEFYPPEWFTHRSYYGRRVDAWSLGVLLYTMIEAEVPFHKEKDTVTCELRYKRARNTTSEACRHLMAIMLQKDQNKRPTLTEVLRHPWLVEGPEAELCFRTPAAAPPAPTEAELVNIRDLFSNNNNNVTTPCIAPSPASPVTPDRGLIAIGRCPMIPTSPVVGCGAQANECVVRS